MYGMLPVKPPCGAEDFPNVYRPLHDFSDILRLLRKAPKRLIRKPRRQKMSNGKDEKLQRQMRKFKNLVDTSSEIGDMTPEELSQSMRSDQFELAAATVES
jgi:hypothetical protein